MQKHNQTNRICYNLLTLNKVGTFLYHFPESSSKTWCKINHIASHCVFCWCETLTWEQTTQVCCSLRWRQNGRHSVSNHQPHDCLFNRLFRRRSKKASKLRVTGLCVGNSPGPVNSPHKGPVTRKMFPFDDVIMVDFDDLIPASDIRIERRQVVFLCWMQDSNPRSQTQNCQQTECQLKNRLNYRGSS